MGYNWNERTELLLGKERIDYLRNCHVLVVGLGGVGAYAAEMICRAGIGKMTIVDADTVNLSNLNRQLAALHSTLGQEKADVIAARLKDINPELDLTFYTEFITDARTEELLDATPFNYIVDAIDSLSPKVYLLFHAHARKIPIVSSMGAGAKIDPTRITIADISKTISCGLARAVRKRLSKMGVSKGIPVVFTPELANPNAVIEIDNERFKRSTAGTVSYMPAVFGCYLASHVIRNI